MNSCEKTKDFLSSGGQKAHSWKTNSYYHMRFYFKKQSENRLLGFTQANCGTNLDCSQESHFCSLDIVGRTILAQKCTRSHVVGIVFYRFTGIMKTDKGQVF